MRIFAFALAGLLAFSSVANASFVIDDYSTAQDFASTPTTSISLFDLPAVTADRTGTIVGTTNAVLNNDFEIIAGVFRANLQGVIAIPDTTVTLLYDNFSTGTIDVTEGGTQLGFFFGDLSYSNAILPANSPAGALMLTINVTTTASSATLSLLAPQSFQQVFIPFASFAPVFDFSSVTSIEIEAMLPSTEQKQLQFTQFGTTTPEPASMALMGLGSLLAGCGVVRRKRKQTAKEMMA